MPGMRNRMGFTRIRIRPKKKPGSGSDLREKTGSYQIFAIELTIYSFNTNCSINAVRKKAKFLMDFKP